MKKNEFVKTLAKNINQSNKMTNHIVEEFTKVLADALRNGDEVALPLGKFQLRHRKERNAFNPQTREQIRVAASVVPAFKPSKSFKTHVSG